MKRLLSTTILRNALIAFAGALTLSACSNAPTAEKIADKGTDAVSNSVEAASEFSGISVREAPTQSPNIAGQMTDLTPVPMPIVKIVKDAPRPNIIYILVDDFGMGDVSYKGSEISTPNLDQMTREGVELDRFYAFPICSPTRTALMTGRSALDYGVTGPLDDRYVAAPNQAFLPQYFKAAGYDTWMVGKWHLGNREIGAFPISRGFDYHYGFLGGFVDFFTHVYWDGRDWQRNGKTVREEGHATDLLTDDALRLISDHDGENPFFMYLAYNAPHTPLQYRDGATSAYDEMESEHRKVYAQMVDHMDASVGKLRATLEAKGLTENTLIVFTSDNGGAERLGSSNGLLRGGKGSVYDGGMRVPGLAVWPGKIAAGGVVDYPVFVQNWAPTLLEAAGITAQAEAFTGPSAWPALTGNIDAPMPGVTFVGSIQGDAVFDWPYKLVREFSRGDAPAPQAELYHIIDDPYEKTNIAASQPDITARLVSLLNARPVVPALFEAGEPPEFLYRNADGSTNYNVRLKETTPPWAERAKGNGG